ncbi:MAG: MazG family protein [Acidimicrobiaceae bacterium]|nr:MazG family protein [Acidimicrobiaceae bacterium]
MAGLITVVGLGPATVDLITAETLAAIASHDRRFVRTSRHPAAVAVGDAFSFDVLSVDADGCSIGNSCISDHDKLANSICERLVVEAETSDILYAVPGSPLVFERSVELLRGSCDNIKILPAVSFLDLAWVRLGIDPMQAGVCLSDGCQFIDNTVGYADTALIANCYSQQILSKIKVAVDSQNDSVVVLQRLGLEDESIIEVACDDLDRVVEADHLTAVFVPEPYQPPAADFVGFNKLVVTLRKHCPWDREQTHSSLRRHLLEETYEVLEAIDQRSALDDKQINAQLDLNLKEELGDLLYQVWFHALLASERDAFTIDDVVQDVHDKLFVRHPHVFGDVKAEDIDSVRANWEMSKKHEKARASVMDGIPSSLPALMRASKVLKRAHSARLIVSSDKTASMSWSQRNQVAKATVDPLKEAFMILGDDSCKLDDKQLEQHLGEVLLAVVELAHRFRIDPEDALRIATDRIEQDFRIAERSRDLDDPHGCSTLTDEPYS